MSVPHVEQIVCVVDIHTYPYEKTSARYIEIEGASRCYKASYDDDDNIYDTGEDHMAR